MPKPYSAASDVFEQERLLKRLRQERDAAATKGDHGLALTLNDRIEDVKAGRLSVERAMRVFEHGLKMRRAREGKHPIKNPGPGTGAEAGDDYADA